MFALCSTKYLWLILQHTYQIQVFTGLTEKEALHPVLFRLVYDVMQSGIPTPTKKVQLALLQDLSLVLITCQNILLSRESSYFSNTT